MRVFIVGTTDDYSLERSYQRAFQQENAQVQLFDIYAGLASYLRLGIVGKLFNQFVPVDAWLRKANRDLAIAIRAYRPDIVLVFCNAPVLFSTLAFVKSIQPARFILVWPDPLTSLQPHVQQAARLYDVVATYCRASIRVFRQLDFKGVQWLPLAADPGLHQLPPPPVSFTYDLTFVGAYRLERERTVSAIVAHYPTLKIGIWGPNWQRSRHKTLRPYIHSHVLRGKAYAALFNQSRINLNVIDDTGYPAANMRFFEIPVAGGLQLSSPCPELADDYRPDEHIVYFNEPEHLIGQIDTILSQPARMNAIRQDGYQHTLAQHTYQHRVRQLISSL